MKSNISIPEINGPHQLAQSLHASQLQIRHHQLAINPSSHLPAPVPPTSPRSHLVKYEIPNASKPDKSRWVPGSLGTQLRSASLAKLLKESPAICPLSASESKVCSSNAMVKCFRQEAHLLQIKAFKGFLHT